MDSVTLESPLDMHLHLRQGEMLERIAPLSASTFAGAVIMPNLVPPIDSLAALQAYREHILRSIGEESFEPYMTLFFRPYNRDVLEKAKPHIIGIKMYPDGVTTNSDGGVQEIHDCEETFRTMEELDIPLLVHGETLGFVMDREREFLDVYRWLAGTFPSLRITMEHITTKEAVDLLDRYPNLHATVTLHHLVITLNDLAGGKLNPHLFCKPIAKRPEDRTALRNAVLEGHPKIMFGSDSAPHPRSSKECSGCAAGIFTAPLAVAMLTELFADANCLDALPAFLSGNARRYYRLAPPQRSVVVRRESMIVPMEYAGVVPFRSGETVRWSIHQTPSG